MTFTWEADDCPWDGEEGESPNEVLGCVCKDRHGAILASLWGIGDPSREYGRVVEAELALESLLAITESAMAAL